VLGHALEHLLGIRRTVATEATRTVARTAAPEAPSVLAHLVVSGELLGGQDPFELGVEALAKLFPTSVSVFQNGAQELDLVVGELERFLHVGEASLHAGILAARGERRAFVTTFGGRGDVPPTGAAGSSGDGEQEGREEGSGHVGTVLSERHWCRRSTRWTPDLTKV
jgi:hypothetical protein